MDQASLVTEEIDAGGGVNPTSGQVSAVQRVLGKDSEGGPWHLYIASDQVRGGHVDAAYRQVLQSTWEMASGHLDALQVKLVPTSDPIAQRR